MVCNRTINHPSKKFQLTPKIFREILLSEKVKDIISANLKSPNDIVSFLKYLRQYATISLRNHDFKVPKI